MVKNTESRNEQARLIRIARAQGFKVIYCPAHLPVGFRYLCGDFYTNAPKGAI